MGDSGIPNLVSAMIWVADLSKDQHIPCQEFRAYLLDDNARTEYHEVVASVPNKDTKLEHHDLVSPEPSLSSGMGENIRNCVTKVLLERGENIWRFKNQWYECICGDSFPIGECARPVVQAKRTGRVLQIRLKPGRHVAGVEGNRACGHVDNINLAMWCQTPRYTAEVLVQVRAEPPQTTRHGVKHRKKMQNCRWRQRTFCDTINLGFLQAGDRYHNKPNVTVGDDEIGQLPTGYLHPSAEEDKKHVSPRDEPKQKQSAVLGSSERDAASVPAGPNSQWPCAIFGRARVGTSISPTS